MESFFFLFFFSTKKKFSNSHTYFRLSFSFLKSSSLIRDKNHTECNTKDLMRFILKERKRKSDLGMLHTPFFERAIKKSLLSVCHKKNLLVSY